MLFEHAPAGRSIHVGSSCHSTRGVRTQQADDHCSCHDRYGLLAFDTTGCSLLLYVRQCATGIEFESDERLRLSCQNGATIVIGLDKGEGGRFKPVRLRMFFFCWLSAECMCPQAFEYASPQREAPPSSPSSVPMDASEDADACVSPIEGTGMPVDAAMEEDSGMPPAAVEEAEETMRRGNRCEYCKQKKIHCGRRAGFKHLPCHIGSRNRFVFLSMRFSG